MTIEQIKKLIPNSDNFLRSTKLTLGWSDEEKYIINLSDETRGLLRVLKKDSYYSQSNAIDLLKDFSKISEAVPKVLDFGLTKDSNFGYILLEYIDGSNAMELIKNYTIQNQYDFGLVMGETIKKLHKMSTPNQCEVEFKKFESKVYDLLDFYEKNKHRFPFLSKKESYIRKFLQKIKNRPFVMLHNDFHLGNMIINQEKISLIDFNRATMGDCIKEFDGIAWSVKSSKYFAQGILDAYLEDEDEQEFFKILKGYINIWQIQMLLFIEDQDEEEKEIVINLIKSVEKWYKNDSDIPSWYF